MVNLGGVESPFLISRWRLPSTCKSTVTIRAEHLAALARSIRFFINLRSRITYSWNQKGSTPASARSSIEQIDIVESVKGIPNFWAAFAICISPSAHIIPIKPTGAVIAGNFTFCPNKVLSSVRLSISTNIFCLNLIGLKSDTLSR